MTGAPTLGQLRMAVETALSATDKISDPQLRGIAFGKVLDHLFVGQPIEPSLCIGQGSSAQPHPPGGANSPSRDGPNAWVHSLFAEGFFSKSRSLAEVTEAVRAQGHNVESKNVTAPLEKLIQSKTLRRERKADDVSKRGVWMYSNY